MPHVTSQSVAFRVNFDGLRHVHISKSTFPTGREINQRKQKSIKVVKLSSEVPMKKKKTYFFFFFLKAKSDVSTPRIHSGSNCQR